jgi:hypothetical protein
MPTYLNSGTSTVYIDDPPLKITAGATATINFYIKPLPSGVALTSHSPVVSPWDLLVAAEGGLIDVSQWDSIIVFNTGEDVATISANTDDANALSIASGAKEVFDNSEGLFGCLEVLTGTISVWGSR